MSLYNPYSLSGKVILITGASSGIGKETAIECSKMGASLIITGRDEERLNSTYLQLVGEGHKVIVADLASEDSLSALIARITKVDGVVLCAGKGMSAPVQYSTPDKFKDVFSINFFSPVELIRRLYKNKVLQKRASVVFVSSIGGVKKITYGNMIYGTSKAAFSSMMKYSAKEFAVRGIRVNSVNPGMVCTKMIDAGTFTEEQREADIQKYPLKRYGRPEDIAYSVIFLLSDASSWITGLELIIDGGVTI